MPALPLNAEIWLSTRKCAAVKIGAGMLKLTRDPFVWSDRVAQEGSLKRCRLGRVSRK